MLDRATLTAEALDYLISLPYSDQVALLKSNIVLRSLEDMKDYRARMAAHAGEVLYQTLPEPGVPSNQLLDELDSE